MTSLTHRGSESGHTFAAGCDELVRRRTGLMPVTILILASVPLCVALMHEDSKNLGLLIGVWLGLHHVASRNGRWRDSATDVRLVTAACLGLAATWIAMGLSYGPYVELRTEVPRPHWDFQPNRMAGFPVRGIPGHDGAGATERLPWPGVLAVLANWSFWLTVAWVALLRLRSSSRKVYGAAAWLALLTTLFACLYFMYTLD